MASGFIGNGDVLRLGTALITAALLLLLSGTGLQGGGLAGGPPATPENKGGSYSTATMADWTLYVDPLGRDSNACTSPGAAACLTFKGAISKPPKILRHRVTITANCGNYAGFSVPEFSTDNQIQQATGGMLIQGTLSSSTTLATGSATGTATGGTTGSGSTFGTLIDSGASWTVNDLRGHFLVITGGTGVMADTVARKVISSNTATTITIDGVFTSAPTGTSTYAIQDPCTVLTSLVTGPPGALIAGVASQTLVDFYANNLTTQTTMIVRRLKVGTASGAFRVLSGTAPQLINIQHSATGGTTRFSHAGTGTLFLTGVYSYYTSTGSPTPIHVVGGLSPISISGSLFQNGGNSVALDSHGDLFFSASENLNVFRGIMVYGNSYASITQSRIGCDGSSGLWGVEVGDRHDGATGGGTALVSDVFFDNCSIMIEQGGAFLSVTGISGLALRWIINARGGAKSVFQSGLTTATSSTVDISLDSGETTANFADLIEPAVNVPGGCVSSLAGHSSVCKR